MSNFVPCRALAAPAGGSRLSLAGLVLVRQMPGSAKGVMFVTLEDETANANLIVWPSVSKSSAEQSLSSSMLGCRGKRYSARGDPPYRRAWARFDE